MQYIKGYFKFDFAVYYRSHQKEIKWFDFVSLCDELRVLRDP